MDEQPTLAMDSEDMRRAITRIAHEILEHNRGARDLAMIGILRRGAPVARRLAFTIAQIEGCAIPVGALDITSFRDDLDRKSPTRGTTDVPFDLNGKRIILVDEVIFTGRSVRAALDALMDLGRPSSVQLACLVDRGHRELPIRPDYVGKNIPTSRLEHVDVKLAEIDGEDSVVVRRGLSKG